MGVMRLIAWKAEAEVMGRLVEVEFSKVGFTLYGLSETEAHEALKVLSTGTLVSVRPGEAPAVPPAIAPNVAERRKVSDYAPPIITPPEKPENKGKAGKKAAETPPADTNKALEEAKVGKPPEKPTEEKKEQAEQAEQMSKATDGLNAATAEEKPEATTGDKAVAAAQGGAAPTGDAPPNNVVPIKSGPPEGTVPDMTKAKQLKDVLAILSEHHGIKDPDALVKKCEELKAEGKVPVLNRIVDVPNRVKRTLEALAS